MKKRLLFLILCKYTIINKTVILKINRQSHYYEIGGGDTLNIKKVNRQNYL